MKFTSVILLALATFAVAAPVSQSASGETDVESVIARAADLAAELDDLLARAPLSTDKELEVRRLLGSSSPLKITFTNPSGPVSAARKKAATKQLTKFISKANQKKFPFCSVEYVFYPVFLRHGIHSFLSFGNGGRATFRCFSSAAKTGGKALQKVYSGSLNGNGGNDWPSVCIVSLETYLSSSTVAHLSDVQVSLKTPNQGKHPGQITEKNSCYSGIYVEDSCAAIQP
ncbi:hypothetical protein DXG03_008132 [Asterophora parasitica]|uniref:Uncharacterized protein n=1 Tax=Asterophora parasitica TaxID=117018 RepID=A0A9P7G4V7_9AGAR|nr:hypothetical protein DXG03_008132 [Asterophora parasitica]